MNVNMNDPATFAKWFSQVYGEPAPDELPDLRERLLHLEGYYLGVCRLRSERHGYTAFDECSGEWLDFADLDVVERDLKTRAIQ
jgi:hypothetical protein